MARPKPSAAPEFTLPAARRFFAKYLADAGKSPRTAETYLEAVDRFTTFAAGRSVETIADVDRELIADWLASMRGAGNSEGTLFNRYNGLKALFRWAVAEEIAERNPVTAVPVPKVAEKPVPVLTEAQVKALLAACRGQGFEEVRDTALIRLLYDTGMRRQEAAGLRGRLTKTGDVEGDLDLDHDVAIVTGKGNRPRGCPYGAKTAAALSRYLRARARRPDEWRGELWLGRKGPLTANGILQAIRRRGAMAGIERLFTHQFRHTAAHSLLADGMQEGDVMRLLGWKSREMLSRYASSTADERARAAYRQHAPGDRL
jgi:site-specific recombinase XerD